MRLIYQSELSSDLPQEESKETIDEETAQLHLLKVDHFSRMRAKSEETPATLPVLYKQTLLNSDENIQGAKSEIQSRYRSQELAVCKQPDSIHVISKTSPIDHTTRLEQSSEVFDTQVESHSSERPLTSLVRNELLRSSFKPNVAIRLRESVDLRNKQPKSVGPQLVSTDLDVNNGDSADDGSSRLPIMRNNNKLQLHSYTNVNQLGLDSPGASPLPASRSMHYLSVENFKQFGIDEATAWRRVQEPSNSAEDHDSTNSNHADDKSRRSVSDSVASSVYGSSGRHRDRVPSIRASFINPSTMAHSSMSRGRPSLMPGSGLSSLAVNSGEGLMGTNNNGMPGSNNELSRATTTRRMSQQEYMRRASNWSRLSMTGQTDMRRLLRLWAHTNPYQWGGHGQGSRSRAGSVESQQHTSQHLNNCSPQNYSPVHSTGGANLSPRPSSVGSARQAYELISAMSRRRSRFGYEQRYTMPLDDMIDSVSITGRDKCLAYCLSWLDVFCIWECCEPWLKLQQLIGLIVFDPFTELFIILCILINTLFMALDSDDAGDEVKSFLDRGNYFFTATFAVEASMKIMALSPKFYFREGWNVFDAIIVGLSLLELGLEGVYGLSVLRSFRLLRVFKLAKSWPTLNLLISIMGKAIGDLGNLTFVLAIIVFIFAVMGMQLFGNKYVAENFPNGQQPRWNFTDFMHSFMIVFRILCAEWIEPMWDCLLVGGWPCIPFFLIAVILGNLVVLNLFLALLLASFGASNLSSPQADNVDTNKLQEAIARFKRFARWSRRKLTNACQAVVGSARRIVGGRLHGCRSSNNNDGNGSRNDSPKDKNQLQGINQPGSAKSAIVAMSKLERKKNIEIKTELLRNKIKSSGLESHEARKHQNLRHLAKSQARESVQQRKRPASSYNFKYQNQPSSSQHKLPTSCPRLPDISISIEQPSPLDWRLSASHGHLDHHKAEHTNASPMMIQPHIPIIIDEPSDLVETESSYISGTADEDGIQAMQQMRVVQSTNNIRVQSTTMQPIREDSKDADSDASMGEEKSISLHINYTSDDQSSDIPKPEESQPKQSIDDQPSNRQTIAIPRNEQYQQLQQKDNQPQAIMRDSLSTHPSITLTRSPIRGQSRGSRSNSRNGPKKSPSSAGMIKIPDMEEEDERTLRNVESYIERCVCLGIICLRVFLFRRFIRKIVEHRYFDQCILLLIVISSGTLALEDKHLNERPNLKKTLDVLDTLFTIVFSLEMVFKWLAFGIRRYFGNLWSWLDFFIVLVSLVNLMASIFGSGKIQALKTMRTLRAMRGLRPLRALQRFQGMRVVVNALIQAIPSIFNVLLVCLIFWLIFSIMGVQMFGGKFWRCLDPISGELVSEKLVDNKQQCLERNLTWSNPQINFDNVLNAYLALFQVVSN